MTIDPSSSVQLKHTIIPHSVEPDWNQAPAFGRRQTIVQALQLLYALHPATACIVETGTIRDGHEAARYGDGWSTLAFGWYAAQTESRAYTVDCDPEALALCRRLTADYASHLEYVQADSLIFFQQWAEREDHGEIHLLYLDSLDYEDRERSEAHSLAEAQAALPLLAPICLALFDDTHPTGQSDANGAPALTGKGCRAVPFLLANGFRCEWVDGGQVLLSRGVDTAAAEQRCANTEAMQQQFAGWSRLPYVTEYLETVLRLSAGGSACEMRIGSGYAAIWLSQQGVSSTGVSGDPRLLDRARQFNSLLGGAALFQEWDLFALTPDDAARYAVIHSQGALEHFALPWLRAALARQVACADWVVFSAPSAYYPFEPKQGDERLLPLEEWRQALAPFDVVELKLYGDPRFGNRDHLLAVLRGRQADAALRQMMSVPARPYPEGISVIVHTRNESRNLAACLQTVAGWTDEIIVCDMESDDDTVEIARRFTDIIVFHPFIANFDRARNVSAMRARYRWIFYLDADERVPPALGPLLRHLLLDASEHDFVALQLPFRNRFAGKWMQCLYPGYKAPSIFENGRFFYNARPHEGAQVDGPVGRLPADNPDLALVHYSYDSIAHYFQKFNAYTDTEATNLFRDGHTFDWKEAVRHAVQDLQVYYDRFGAVEDGVHGLIYSLLSATYRFVQYAKLYEHRYQRQQLQPAEMATPANVEELLEYALSLARAERPTHTASQANSPFPVGKGAGGLGWHGPLYSASGYGEECRNFVLALEAAGVEVAARVLPWNQDVWELNTQERERLEAMTRRQPAAPALCVVHDLAPNFTRPPDAGLVIGRTMFETDRLPIEWVQACNRMDAVWVPSEFNRRTFAESGVPAEKLAVMPPCLDPAAYERPPLATPLTQEIAASNRFTFLSVFDWTLHKGWDLLLRGFLEAFPDRDDVGLVLKVWSSLGYTGEQILTQAADWVGRETGCDLRADGRIRFVWDRLSQPELIALYHACDAFVLPSRGEGWGRPYMEAMACGLPTIGTNWSGNTAFMTSDNSYLLDYALQDVPEIGWREIPAYRGHRWAEPDRDHLGRQLRRVVAERAEATAVGQRARHSILTQYSREQVGQLMTAELARLLDVAEARSGSLPVERQTPHSGQTAFGSATPNGKPTPPAVRWEGALFSWHSLALVNRELCLGLLQGNQIELSFIPTEPAQFSPEQEPRYRVLAERLSAPLSRPPDVHLRHSFPPRFDPPQEGHLVLIQPWEFGAIPRHWVEPIRQHVSEIWCPSHYVRDVYRSSGIPAEQLHVVPNGVDTGVFNPSASPYLFTQEAGVARVAGGLAGRFVFLFVGGTLSRKGIDILLEAYLRAFSAYDDVCLVIKDTGAQTVYRGMNQRERLLQLASDPTRPALIYLDDDLPAAQMASLYRVCDCLVQPYRGEGFCLPALEAMACGRPVIVPQGGATDDFVDESVGWRIAAERRPLPGGKVGDWECAGESWLLEASPDDLARLLRQVAGQRTEAARRGEAGAQRAEANWTWRHACEAAHTRLEALRQRPAPPRAHRSFSGATIETIKPAGNGLTGERAGQKAPALQTPIAHRTPPGRPRISLCMIVRDEERVLADCLGSVRAWVDEIIVVDTGSTDRTREIAREMGAKVFDFPWTESFSEARNESLRYATGDWILWVDADDTLPAASGEAIRRATQEAGQEIAGFVIPVQFVEDGTPAGGTRVDHVKLFRNRPGLNWEGRIHEQILPSLRATGGLIARCDAVVLHSGYDTSPEGQARKRVRDLRLLKLDLKDRPGHPFVLFNIGMTYHYTGEHRRAVRWLRKCLRAAEPTESIVRKAYAMLAMSLRELGRPEEALVALEEGLRITPDDPELHFHMGYIFSAQEKYPLAKEHYLKTVAADITAHFSSVDMGILGYKTFHNLGGICLLLNDYPGAREWWLKTLETMPRFLASGFALFDAALQAGDWETARRMLTVVHATEGPGENWAQMGCRFAEAAGTPADAEAWLRQAIASEPNANGARLTLARRLLQSCREQEAREHLLWLSQAGNAEATFFLGVMAIRCNDLRQALEWMERAHALNPTHDETLEQIHNLQRALGLNGTGEGASTLLKELPEPA
jgi:glycosyltransferase involved in cell wall biosynthesis